MDTSITPLQDSGEIAWGIAENGGEACGTIRQDGPNFRIDAHPGSRLDGVAAGPYRHIDDAVTAIEKHTGGRCHPWSGG